MKVFISYSRNDAEFVERLKTELEAGKIGVTIDIESLAFGDDLQEFVERSVCETDLTIAVISRNSLQSVWVIAEALETLMHEKVLGRKKYLPIYIDTSFLDDSLYLQIVEQIDASIATLKDLTVQGIDRHLGTAHLDQKRERFITLRHNLSTILKKLADVLVVDFSSEAKFAENLPKLLEVITQGPEINETLNARHNQGGHSSSPEITALRNHYLQWLFAKVTDVPLADIDPHIADMVMDNPDLRLTLDAIYTTLLTISTEQAAQPELAARRTGERQALVPALAQLDRHQYLVLLGDPGSGKSTFVNFVTMCLAGALLNHPAINLDFMNTPFLETDEDEILETDGDEKSCAACLASWGLIACARDLAGFCSQGSA